MLHNADHPLRVAEVVGKGRQQPQSQSQQQQPQPQPQQKVTIGDDDTFSACLLVMDDNHFLIEWIAYHYHALPLRYLIVAVDPRSQTSPMPILDRWRDKMTIVPWTRDEDYMTVFEREQAEDVVRRHFGNLTANLVRHRARQRIFYDKCMKQLKAEGQSWSILTDTDEFLRINTEKAQALQLWHNSNQQPLTVEEPASIRSLLKAELQRPGTNLTRSPCIQIPRLRFGAVVDDEQDITSQSQSQIPPGFNATQFLTLQWRHHAGVDQYKANKISKVIIDVSQVPWSELVPVESIHRPIKSLCSQRKLHIRSPDSVLVINHYLGSWEQYEYRQDARISGATINEGNLGDGRSRQQYDKQKMVNAATNDEIQPWLQGFVTAMGQQQAEALLKGVGQLEPNTHYHATVALAPLAFSWTQKTSSQ